MRSRRNLILGIGLIIFATTLVYTPALRGGFFWDDNTWFGWNKALGSWKALRTYWTNPRPFQAYYPLTPTTFWLEYQLWQLKPFGYHLVNLLLHVGNALLLWALLSKLKLPGAWIAALFFALHPVHVESVAWISERKNVLSCFFYLMAVLALIRFFQLGTFQGEKSRRSWIFYLLTLGLFSCSVLSKPTTCTFPVVALILLWWRQDRLSWKVTFLLLPLFLMALAMGGATFWVERNYANAYGIEFSQSFLERCLIAGRAVWFYLGKLLWPVNQAILYPKWKINSSHPWEYLSCLSVLGSLIALWFLRKKIGRAPFVALLFFVITLSPTLGFINFSSLRYSFVADHWQYHASMGVIALGAGILKQRLKIPDSVGGLRFNLGSWLLAAVIVVLGAGTWQRSLLFKDKDEVSFWREAVRKSPEAAIAHNNLGVALQYQGQLLEAESHYLKALELRSNYVDARNNLAVILTGQGKLEEAVRHLKDALAIKPEDASAHTNLGIALAQQGKLEEAIQHFSEAIQIEPDSVEGHYNLRIARARKR